MNLNRYQRVSHNPRNLGLIATHLNAPSLETVTADEGPQRRTSIETASDDVPLTPLNPHPSRVSVQFPSVFVREVNQEWPQSAREAFRNAHVTNTLVIPDLGVNGTICISAGPYLYVWLVTQSHIPPRPKTIMPVNGDILAMCCIKPTPQTIATLNDKVLVLAYPRAVCIYEIFLRDEEVHLSDTHLMTEINFIPTAITGGCNGRIFIGSNDGSVHEVHYLPKELYLQGRAFFRRCSVQSLNWYSTFSSRRPVEKLIVDDASKTLIAIGSQSTLAFFTLGQDGTGIPVFQKSYHPPSELGQFNFGALLTIIPMESEKSTFEGMCVFSDGKRLKIRLTVGDNVTLQVMNWVVQSGWNATIECDSAMNQIPLSAPGHVPGSRLTYLVPSSDGCSWLMCESLAAVSSLSLLYFLDSVPRKRMENGGAFFRNQLRLDSPPLQIVAQKSNTNLDFSGFDQNTDLISLQFDPVVTRHLVLEEGRVSVIKVLPPIDLLGVVLRTRVPGKLTEYMRQYCKLLGTVETAAMICLMGYKLQQALDVFGREDLFGAPKIVTRPLPTVTPQQPYASGIMMVAGETSYTEGEPVKMETDIQFSDTFKGMVLCLRQILRTFWWSTVLKIAKDPDTQQLHAEHKLSKDGLFWNINALRELHKFVGSYCTKFDPRIGGNFILTNGTHQTEIHEMMAVMLLAQRCLEAVTILGVYSQREIDSIIQEMTEAEIEALNNMTFNHLVFCPKQESPITPFLKATLKRLEIGSGSYREAVQFYIKRIPTYWNQKDCNEYEALRKLEAARLAELPFQPPSDFKLLNGPFRDLID